MYKLKKRLRVRQAACVFMRVAYIHASAERVGANDPIEWRRNERVVKNGIQGVFGYQTREYT